MEVEASHLKTMGLNPKRAALDEHIGFSKWTKKKDLHRKVKAQTGTADKPDAEVWFRHEKGTTCSSAVRCNVCIYIIKVQATVKKGGEDDADKDIPAEYYLCKEETGAWAVVVNVGLETQSVLNYEKNNIKKDENNIKKDENLL